MTGGNLPKAEAKYPLFPYRPLSVSIAALVSISCIVVL